MTGEVDELRYQFFDVFDMLFDRDNDNVIDSYLITGDTGFFLLWWYFIVGLLIVDISDADPFANSLILLHRAYGRHLLVDYYQFKKLATDFLRWT